MGVFEKKVIADIPGLIEGASTGKGLGISFLKHIEKVKMLVHCVDLTSEDLLADYNVVRKELKEFSPKIARKKEIIVLTKVDLVEESKVKAAVKLFEKKGHSPILLSIYDEELLNKFTQILSSTSS